MDRIFEALTKEEKDAAWRVLNVTCPDAPNIINDFKEYKKKVEDNACILCFSEGDNIEGMIAFYCNDYNQGVAYITQIAVLPEVQKKGIGRQLIEKCEKKALEKGMTSLRLEVADSNENAQLFYKAMNFRTEKRVSRNSRYLIKSLK